MKPQKQIKKLSLKRNTIADLDKGGMSVLYGGLHETDYRACKTETICLPPPYTAGCTEPFTRCECPDTRESNQFSLCEECTAVGGITAC